MFMLVTKMYLNACVAHNLYQELFSDNDLLLCQHIDSNTDELKYCLINLPTKTEFHVYKQQSERMRSLFFHTKLSLMNSILDIMLL